MMTARALPVFLELIENFDTGEVGKSHVEQHQVGGFALGEAKGGFAGIGFDDDVAPLFAFLAQRPAHQTLVVYDHDLFCRHRRSHCCASSGLTGLYPVVD